jgi:hypothetical protein
MKKRWTVLYLLSGSCLFAQNVVTDWAAIVQPILNTPAKPPATQYLLRAIVQIGVYDAAMTVSGSYKPFTGEVTLQPGADLRAAVATAAYHVTRTLVSGPPAAALDSQYDAYLAGIPEGNAKSAGIQVGQTAAAAVEALRADDGRNNTVLFDCRTNPQPTGIFEPDGGCGTQPLNVNLGLVKPFTFTDPKQFRPTGPDSLTSNNWVQDFIETRDYGRKDSTVRTAEQTDIAWFWQAIDISKSLNDLAISHGLNAPDTARLLAMGYTAMADAAIAGFDAKYYFQFWRPRTAIVRADVLGNPDTPADPTWTPLISVNHPEYPSAHSFITTALVDIVRRFFGTSKVNWALTASKAAAPQLVTAQRTYQDLNALLAELYNARVWAGLHWRHSTQHGADLGRKVAQNVADKFF